MHRLVGKQSGRSQDRQTDLHRKQTDVLKALTGMRSEHVLLTLSCWTTGAWCFRYATTTLALCAAQAIYHEEVCCLADRRLVGYLLQTPCLNEAGIAHLY